MDIVQPPVTDLIPASVLTAQGDIIVRGAGQAERLAIGTARQILRVNAGSTGLEYLDFGTHISETEQSAENVGAVTVLIGTTELVSLLNVAVVTGERIFVQAIVNGIKGATAGMNTFEVTDISGNNCLRFFNDTTYIGRRLYIPNGEIWYDHLFGIAKVVSTNLCNFALRGNSMGSNTAVAIGDAQLAIAHLKNL